MEALSLAEKATQDRFQARLPEHLQWAAKHNALPQVAEFLRGLREDEWHHLGE